MASRAIGQQSAPVTLPNHFAPMPTVMRTLAQFDRASLEGFITVAIGLLDVVDGDPELLEDATDAEDAFQHTDFALACCSGPGCEISDCDKGADDVGEEEDYV